MSRISNAPRTSAKDRGWHLEFLLKPHQLIELEPRLAKLSCPVSFDHLAFIKPADGIEQSAFQALLRLLASGNGWVKFSGAYRVSGQAERYDQRAAVCAQRSSKRDRIGSCGAATGRMSDR